MGEEAARDAHRLYQQHRAEIKEICRHAYEKTTRSSEQPPLDLEDVLQESYLLFLRCLVRYDPEQGGMDTYLRHALRSRVTDYLRSRSTRQAEPEESRSRGQAAEVDVVDEVRTLIDEGRLDGGALWDRLGLQ